MQTLWFYDESGEFTYKIGITGAKVVIGDIETFQSLW
jgi:glutaminase